MEATLGTSRRGLRRMLVVAGLALALFAVGGAGLLTRTPAGAPASVSPAATDRSPVVVSGTLAEAIAGLQARLRALPGDDGAWASLGLAYVQQARITADPSYYPKAEAALQRSLEVRPVGNDPALAGLGALALARHDFAGALAFGQRAARINAYSANAHGVMGDALVELGRYPEAFAQFQKMVDLRPDLASYARASYAHELQGDVPGAAAIMNLALQAAGTAADRAWAYHQLGELAWNAGDLGTAEHDYTLARRVDPSFLPPLAGLAKVQAARGHIEQAIRTYTRVVAAFPLPEYVAALGDLYRVSGDADGAANQDALLHLEERLFRSNGVNMDLEVAQFDADHRTNLAAGLVAARAEWGRRQSVVVADALAWALYANGRFTEALGYADRALALGTASAAFHFHRGMIERALGRDDAAIRDLRTALDLNPRFSVLWAGPAARILAGLTGAGA